MCKSVKVGYSCAENMKSVIIADNKKLLSKNIYTASPCNPTKVYLGTTEGDFKQRF